MTDIIDKVAEAVRAEALAHDDCIISSADGAKSLATAALEALADGLVWSGNYLDYKSVSLGHVYRGHECWWWEFEDAYGSVDNKPDAQTALLNHARRVLFGLGPIGGDNG